MAYFRVGFIDWYREKDLGPHSVGVNSLNKWSGCVEPTIQMMWARDKGDESVSDILSSLSLTIRVPLMLKIRLSSDIWKYQYVLNVFLLRYGYKHCQTGPDRRSYDHPSDSFLWYSLHPLFRRFRQVPDDKRTLKLTLFFLLYLLRTKSYGALLSLPTW